MHLGYSVPITIEEPASWQTRFAWVCGSQRWLDLVIAVALPGTTGKSGCRTHRGLYDQARECLRGNLFRISTWQVQAGSFLSQFFQSRRHFSSQANRSTTHRFGSTTAFHHFHRGSQQAAPSGKGLSGAVQARLHLTEAVSAPVKHRQSPGPVGNVGGSHVYRMGQSWRVHRDSLSRSSGQWLASTEIDAVAVVVRVPSHYEPTKKLSQNF